VKTVRSDRMQSYSSKLQWAMNSLDNWIHQDQLGVWAVTPGTFFKSLFAVWGHSGAYWQQIWLFCRMKPEIGKKCTKI